MALDFTAKLIQRLGQQTGQGKNGTWVKQEFIVETLEQYPRKVCASAWGEKVKEMDGVAIGETVKLSVNLESREFNGRWYTDVRIWRVERMRSTESSAPDLPPFPDGLPMPPAANDFSPTDDLPF